MTHGTQSAPQVTRNATIGDLAAVLQNQHGRRVDVVAPASAVRAVSGRLMIDNTEPIITSEGVTRTAGVYTPTVVCDEGIADKLKIPSAYLRRTRVEAPELYDANVNGWLDREEARKFLIRNLRGEDDGGVARAFLSDGYKIIDNLDVLMSALDGVRQAGVPVNIDGCDLTDRRMYVRVVSEEVRALAPELLRRYRSPFTGATGADNPVVFAGFVISNSETGCGAFSITPRLVVQVCNNGMTITKDALRNVHLGGRMDQGVINWSDDTQERNLALIAAKARDAVTTFLDPGYLRRKVNEIEAEAATPIKNPEEAVKVISKQMRYSDERQADILNHFIRGADVTAGGVMHAVTSVAQTVPDADAAADMESQAMRVMELAARL